MLPKCLDFCGSKSTSSSKKHYPMVIEELCHQFSLEDIRKSTNNFDEKLVIGRGGFGTLYKGYLNGVTDYTIALKRLKGPHLGCREDWFKKEIELLCQLRHPNLVSLIGFCNHKDEKIIVYEYMPNGSLDNRLRNRDMEPLSWKNRLEICIGVACGLHYLHTGAKRSVFHRDIKPLIILLDNNMVPKLSDFRLSLQGPLSTSKPKPIEVDNVAGTIGYIAPEYFHRLIFTDKCDVYSFGMVLLQMVCTKDDRMVIDKANMLADQYLGENENKHLDEFIGITWPDVGAFVKRFPIEEIIAFVKRFPIEEIIDPILNGKIAPQCWKVFVDIIQRCLYHEPDERPAMGEVEVLLEYALSLQEEADIRKIEGGHTLLSTTIIHPEPAFCD